MCYLGVLPRRSAMTLEMLRNAFDHNSDGYGIMYADGGRVVTWKHKGKFEEFAAFWETLPANKYIAVHFRFGTSGPSNADACHPFEVLNKAQHGMDLWLMHNGVLDHTAFPGTKKASDTMQYVHKLRTMLQGNPQLIRNQAFREFLERDLGNPNKMVLLEGNGRWHYLNRWQGTERDGVWHSNTYSLNRVYSGHGRGKAANTTAAWDEDWYGGKYGEAACNVTRNDAGNVIQSPMLRTYSSTTRLPEEGMWSLQIVREDGKEDQQHYWKRGYSGWLRMQRDPKTRRFHRHFMQHYEKGGEDYCTVLPANTIKFKPKNPEAWEAGKPHTWTMEGGEHVPVPIDGDKGSASTAVTLYQPHEARAAVTPLLDLKDVPMTAEEVEACDAEGVTLETLRQDRRGNINYLCPETNEACQAGCVTSCTGQTFPLARHGAGDGPSVAEVLARHEATLEEREAQEEEYMEQLFSDNNLRQMGEDEMIEACEDHPSWAAYAMGRLLNRPWAWEDVA